MNDSANSIFASIRKNLPKEKVDYPKIPTFEVSGKDLMGTFQENLLKAGASFYKVSSVEEAQSITKKIYPDAKIICSAAPEWVGNKDIHTVQKPQDVEDVDIAVVRAEFGVAEMGMVWLTERALQDVNSLAYLCQSLVVLLDPDKITENMHTAYLHTELNTNNYGCFVMGPSATADIGAVLIHGAQGPRSLVVFLLK